MPWSLSNNLTVIGHLAHWPTGLFLCTSKLSHLHPRGPAESPRLLDTQEGSTSDFIFRFEFTLLFHLADVPPASMSWRDAGLFTPQSRSPTEDVTAGGYTPSFSASGLSLFPQAVGFTPWMLLFTERCFLWVQCVRWTSPLPLSSLWLENAFK